jgi:hypothetical protein
MSLVGDIQPNRRAKQERRLLSDRVVRHNMATRAGMAQTGRSPPQGGGAGWMQTQRYRSQPP